MKDGIPNIHEWDEQLRKLDKHTRLLLKIHNPIQCHTEDSAPSMRRASIVRSGEGDFLIKRGSAETIEYFDTDHGRKIMGTWLKKRKAEPVSERRANGDKKAWGIDREESPGIWGPLPSGFTE